MACLRYCVLSIIRIRKKNKTHGRTKPMPKQTRHTPDEVRSWYAASTMSAMTPAPTKPRSIEKSVDRATRRPRRRRTYWLSSAASVLPVAHVGYLRDTSQCGFPERRQPPRLTRRLHRNPQHHEPRSSSRTCRAAWSHAPRWPERRRVQGKPWRRQSPSSDPSYR